MTEPERQRKISTPVRVVLAIIVIGAWVALLVFEWHRDGASPWLGPLRDYQPSPIGDDGIVILAFFLSLGILAPAYMPRPQLAWIVSALCLMFWFMIGGLLSASYA